MECKEAIICQLTLGINTRGELFIDISSVPLEVFKYFPEIAHVGRQVKYKMEDIVADIIT